MMETAESRPWSDLQPELLGLVLRRLPSIADRVRLRAVCHPWRSNSMLQTLPLPFPWLTLPDGTFLSIPAGEVHRMPVPDGACCHGSVDNWLFLISCDGRCSLLNPFSKTMLELPDVAKVWKRKISDIYAFFSPLLYKLVVPSPLGSAPDSLVAALIKDGNKWATLCISQPPIATDSFRDDQIPVLQIEDVAFIDGKLYTLGRLGNLCIVQLGKDLRIISTECIIHSSHEFDRVPKYLSKVHKMTGAVGIHLVECGGRLLAVKRWFNYVKDLRSDGGALGYEHTVAFEVFEADLSTNPGRWRRVSDLGGHALFLGQRSSKSLPATECSGYREDCIYFISDDLVSPYSPSPLLDSGVYNMRNGKITPLMSQTAAVPPQHTGQWCPTWFFPPETV